MNLDRLYVTDPMLSIMGLSGAPVDPITGFKSSCQCGRVSVSSKKSAEKISVLLLLAVIGSHAAPNASECDGLTKRLPTKDLNKIFRNWVLVWSVSDHEAAEGLLAKASSSHVEFKLLPDNKTFTYIDRSIFHHNLSSCTTSFIHMTVPSNNEAELQTLHADNIRLEEDGQPVEYNDTGAVDFYESCSDCLLLVYKSSRFRFVLSYKEEGSHRDVEQHKAAHDDHRKFAECLGFPKKKPYVYDGVADFCHKKSAPEANPDNQS
ncbi:saxitoxin and tetrodotoxin-binding protein 1 [Oryzias latipes]|uniref:saxitoxin and tetrodotoxin-binding protein 1 n=1 Tax=Oryzias latipes TaxID=8090 RepID=UPI0009DA6FB7|nr:saxitoxin and tetrodotoxin-binding protein 1 [Oryzias latipes]